MRKRSIWPGACFDEDLHELGDLTWRLFVSLPMMADRDGLLEDRPARIKAQIFPFHDQVTSTKIGHMLDALERVGKLDRYEADGRPYLAIKSWVTHQSPHHKEAESRIPKPSVVHESCTSHAQTLHEPTIPPTPTPTPTPIASPSPTREASIVESAIEVFDELWPTDDGKFDKYRLRLDLERLVDDIDLPTLRANVRAYLTTPRCREEWPRYVAKAHDWIGRPGSLAARKRPPGDTTVTIIEAAA